MEYFGTKLLDDDAIEKIVGSFFHYLHSFFDNFAQFINFALLGNIAVDINKASFLVIKNRLKELPEYHKIFNELENFSQTLEFGYIEDFNNINKHQYTIDVQSTLFLNDGQIEQKIPQFQKKERFHDSKELKEKMLNSFDATLKFFETVTKMVFDQLKQNNHNYITNRYHNVSIKTQLGFGEGQNGGAVLLKVDNSNITNGNIFYLLLSKIEFESNKIVTQNILTDSVIVQDSNGHNIGILEALEPPNANIIKYRKYKLTLHSDMRAIYMQHFFKPKKLQMGFGEGEIIQIIQDNDSNTDERKDEESDSVLD